MTFLSSTCTAIFTLSVAAAIMADAGNAQTSTLPETTELAVPPPPPPPKHDHPRRGVDCDYASDGTLTLSPGAYPSCIVQAKKLILAGDGDFTLGNSLIVAETIIIKSNGRVKIPVSDVRADKLVFVQGAAMDMSGATIIAKEVCGDLRGAYASGMTMIAQDRISLNLINADIQGSTFKTDTFGPGTMDNAHLYTYTQIDCRTNLADFSGAVGHALGHCPEPEKPNPDFVCDY
ncbi:MAG: hypothetical protein WA790_08060 [Sulfitobacter sp.]